MLVWSRTKAERKGCHSKVNLTEYPQVSHTCEVEPWDFRTLLCLHRSNGEWQRGTRRYHYHCFPEEATGRHKIHSYPVLSHAVSSTCTARNLPWIARLPNSETKLLFFFFPYQDFLQPLSASDWPSWLLFFIQLSSCNCIHKSSSLLQMGALILPKTSLKVYLNSQPWHLYKLTEKSRHLEGAVFVAFATDIRMRLTLLMFPSVDYKGSRKLSLGYWMWRRLSPLIRWIYPWPLTVLQTALWFNSWLLCKLPYEDKHCCHKLFQWHVLCQECIRLFHFLIFWV